jgi:hypothetical protein
MAETCWTESDSSLGDSFVGGLRHALRLSSADFDVTELRLASA